MATQILEGTFAEVQEQISKLHFKPEKRVRVILETAYIVAPHPDLLRILTP